MKIIGHRGARGLAPENTVASFQAALDNSVDMIEFDIRTSLDNVLVIHHNPKTIHGLVIVKTSYKDLRKSLPELVTFSEMLDFIKDRKPLAVEIKKGSNIDVVIAALKDAQLPAGSIIISFNFPILKAVKKAFPDVDLLVIHKWSGVIATHRARVLNTKYIAINNRWLWSGFIKAITRSGYKLIPYTMNDPKKVKRWSKLGLYAIVTDHPERFLKL